MADVDTDPFGEHDKTESRTDDHTETGENIPFTPVGEEEDHQLGNQNVSKKLHSEENLKELNS